MTTEPKASPAEALEAKKLRIGPVESEWVGDVPRPGTCGQCGGQCDGGDCGLHAAGCQYGGFGEGYWLIADGCPLYHGEREWKT